MVFVLVSSDLRLAVLIDAGVYPANYATDLVERYRCWEPLGTSPKEDL